MNSGTVISGRRVPSQAPTATKAAKPINGRSRLISRKTGCLRVMNCTCSSFSIQGMRTRSANCLLCESTERAIAALGLLCRASRSSPSGRYQTALSVSARAVCKKAVKPSRPSSPNSSPRMISRLFAVFSGQTSSIFPAASKKAPFVSLPASYSRLPVSSVNRRACAHNSCKAFSSSRLSSGWPDSSPFRSLFWACMRTHLRFRDNPLGYQSPG